FLGLGEFEQGNFTGDLDKRDLFPQELEYLGNKDGQNFLHQATFVQQILSKALNQKGLDSGVQESLQKTLNHFNQYIADAVVKMIHIQYTTLDKLGLPGFEINLQTTHTLSILPLSDAAFSVFHALDEQSTFFGFTSNNS